MRTIRPGTLTYGRAAPWCIAATVIGLGRYAPGCEETSLDVLHPPVAAASSVPAPDGSVPPPEPECATGLSVGEPCSASWDCCSGLCALDPAGAPTCRPTPGCEGVGRLCGLASQCCALACTVSEGGYFCSGEGLCSVATEACQASPDCCTGICKAGVCTSNGAGCRPAGELCAAAGDCCGQVCSAGADQRTRCQLLQGCRVGAELCATASDCCTASCALDKSGASRCKTLAACTAGDGKACQRQVGEICRDANECCSRLCLATSDGSNRCAPAPGCRPQCDLCYQPADCCSGACQADASGIGRCVGTAGLLPEGETCDREDQCDQAAGATRCVEDPKGTKGKRCRLDAPASACLADGAACALASRCCGGHCVPDPPRGFVCSSVCSADGQSCTSRADCCGAVSDCLVVAGERVCEALIR